MCIGGFGLGLGFEGGAVIALRVMLSYLSSRAIIYHTIVAVPKSFKPLYLQARASLVTPGQQRM